MIIAKLLSQPADDDDDDDYNYYYYYCLGFRFHLNITTIPNITYRPRDIGIENLSEKKSSIKRRL